MTLIQHSDEKVRFQQQVDNSSNYVVPFIEKEVTIKAGMNVMDIGCGDGGVLIPFLDKGCNCIGIELDEIKSNFARRFLATYIDNGMVEIINQNIYEEKALEKYAGQFDLILLKDVIEHIPRQDEFIPYLKKFLKPGGYVYFGFPPWYMPHGGHQQVCKNKLLTVLPWFHLLPKSLYKGVLKMSGEYDPVIKELLEIKDTGISIERFERLVKNSGYTIPLKTFYLINPIYQYKFGLKPRKQLGLISAIPFFRNFVTTCAYYLIKKPTS
jgi:2-polyprenyl-3-methyl-5-hydroxy-6-metoxy-1,4-benzoquinol methylase